jgi:Tfp pilus assembly protein PilN
MVMVNLLPPDTKRQIRAARMNVTLYRYCLLIVFTALLLGGVFAVGFWSDGNDRRLAEEAKAESQTAAAPYANTKSAAEAFAADLNTARTILGGNVSFSKLVLDIAAIVPRGVVLNNLALGTTAKADTPIDISGRATSYDAAVALKNSLEASPIFEKVNIVNINQTDISGANVSDIAKNYPFAVSLKAVKSPQAAQGSQQ